MIIKKEKLHRVDVLTFGELLIDFVPTISGVSLIEAPAFNKAPGGAPANVAVGLARLGVPSGFMGKVGDDAFGHFLADTLVSNHVDISGMHFSPEARTMLAFVSLKSDCDRDFMFYRHPSADMLFAPEEVDLDLIRSTRIFHYGSISLISEPARSATLFALEVAGQAGLLISYDPNLRINLWPDQETAREEIRRGWDFSQVIKASEEEIYFLSNDTDLVRGARKLWHPKLKILLVTQGERGCTIIKSDFFQAVPGFKVKAVDTTGAGDGFMAGLLKGIVEGRNPFTDNKELQSICRYANAVGALTTTRRGAIPALPTASQVDKFLSLYQ